MDIILWIAQGIVALAFLFFGFMHAAQWPRLEADPRSASLLKIGQQRMAVIGALEILGAIGLVVPAATGILPWLTPLAALGLALLMLGASAFHLNNIRREGTDEQQIIVINAVLGLGALFIFIGRTFIDPLS